MTFDNNADSGDFFNNSSSGTITSSDSQRINAFDAIADGSNVHVCTAEKSSNKGAIYYINGTNKVLIEDEYVSDPKPVCRIGKDPSTGKPEIFYMLSSAIAVAIKEDSGWQTHKITDISDYSNGMDVSYTDNTGGIALVYSKASTGDLVAWTFSQGAWSSETLGTGRSPMLEPDGKGKFYMFYDAQDYNDKKWNFTFWFYGN